MINAESIIGSNFYDCVQLIVDQYENVDVTITKLDGQTYATVSELGFSFMAEDPIAIDCVQVSPVDSGGESGVLALPLGLGFSDSPQDARRKLGSPREHGGGVADPISGRAISRWDAFEVNGHRCHLEYLPDDSGIALVSLELRWFWRNGASV